MGKLPGFCVPLLMSPSRYARDDGLKRVKSAFATWRMPCRRRSGQPGRMARWTIATSAGSTIRVSQSMIPRRVLDLPFILTIFRLSLQNGSTHLKAARHLRPNHVIEERVMDRIAGI